MISLKNRICFTCVNDFLLCPLGDFLRLDKSQNEFWTLLNKYHNILNQLCISLTDLIIQNPFCIPLTKLRIFMRL
jgi:hypothetical protein